jgi:hypothetical protein
MLMIIIALPMISQACEICGCGVGNQYIGILPDFRKHVFGLRYRYSSLYTHVGIGGASTYLTTKEKYNIVELYGGWNITDKIRLMASLPYAFNDKTNQGTTVSKNGISDIYLSGYYQLFNSRKTTAANKLLVQSLWLGGGIKLPTGKYNPSDKSNSTQNANLFQLGTGSTDFLLNAMYDVRLQDVGLNVSTSYKVNTANKYEYTYGNKFNINAEAYYKFSIKNKFTVAPNAGIQYENSAQDDDNGLSVEASGGNLLVGTIGVETSLSRISIGANYQTPLHQNLGKGIIKANDKCMVHISFTL